MLHLALAIIESRKTDIEKYQYLSVLRNTNVHLFYRLLAKNIKVRYRDRLAPPRHCLFLLHANTCSALGWWLMTRAIPLAQPPRR